MAEEGFRCKRYVDICTDGARSMVGNRNGFIAHVKVIAPECTHSHRIIHREALSVKNIQNALKTVFTIL
jgi:hypothetical protein